MNYQPVGVAPQPTSSALTPAEGLDPDLFDGDRMKPDVRLGILGLIQGYLAPRFQNVQGWLRAWMAGSGASYRWHAALDMRDLDILMGIDFIAFRRANPGYSGVSNAEIASHLNDMLRRELWPATERWRDQYEMTFYALETPDIRTIRPYAAYDLNDDDWTVHPVKTTRAADPQWDLYATLYHERAVRAVDEYGQALGEVHAATNPAHRINAEARFQHAVRNASELYEAVHRRRGVGFAPTGEGYDDLGNYLWQQGKAAGWVPALRQIHDYRRAAEESHAVENYGVELPTADTLVRRAAMQYGRP